MVTLAILAGGNATRMGGKNKAFIEIDGETFVKRIYRNLSPLFDSTIIISNDSSDFDIPGVSVFPDIYPNQGPLGGIHSALINSKNDYVFVVSCDMPFVDAEIAKALIEEFFRKKPEIIVPTINSYIEPLFAIYSKELTKKIESIVESTSSRSIRGLLQLSNTSYFEFPNTPIVKRCFTNINSLNDLEGF